MIAEEVTASEEEVFGSMSATVLARGSNARRGVAAEGCCVRALMGANWGSKLSHGATKRGKKWWSWLFNALLFC